MNKKEMLKIAGVTSEREFYKLYKTEEDFMKVHKKSFKKAILGDKIKKAQQGATQGGFNQQNAGMNTGATTQADVQGAISNLSTGTAKKTVGQSISDGVKDVPILGSLVSGIVGLFDAGAERKRQVRAGALSDLQLQASQSAPRQQNRKYNRPDMDANVADINSLMPAEGTGTNLLGRDGVTIAKRGGEIANTYAPNTIYSDMGYEPLSESERIKNYYNGGEIPQASFGAILSMLTKSGGSSGGGSGIMDLVSGLLKGGGGGSTPTTVETTTLDPSQFVMRNNFSPTYVRINGGKVPQAQNGGSSMEWLTKILNTNKGSNVGAVQGSSANSGIAGLVGQAVNSQGTTQTAGQSNSPQSTEGLSKDTNASDMIKGTGNMTPNADAIPGMNTKMAQSSKQIGQTVGSVIPIPGASEVLGLVAQGIGAIAEDKSGQKALKRIERNTNQMAATQAAKTMQSNQQSYMRTGGQLKQNSPDMEKNGELNTLWGGHAESISYNPYLGEETITFKGNSHEESDGHGRTGIGVRYGEGGDLQPYNANVEVEAGEPAVQLPDEIGEKNLVVFGNLHIPNQFIKQLGDPDAKGKKFKNYVTLLSKKEEHQNKIVEKAITELEGLEPKTPYEKIKFDTLAITFKGANQKLKEIAKKKENAAHLQQAINDTAEERGIDADALAKGTIKAMKGAKVAKAQNGERVVNAPDGTIRYYYSDGTFGITYKNGLTATYDAKGNEISRAQVDKPESDIKPIKDTGKQSSTKKLTKEQKATIASREADNKSFPTRMKSLPAKLPQESIRPFTEIAKPITEKEKGDIPQFFNPLGTYLPSNKQMLDPRQLTGEYYALATNQLEPVPAQQYHPTLKTPYEISLQDILNENTATLRSQQRLGEIAGNPAFQSQVAAQQYGANQKVLADQFRINQESKMKVYDENTNILNDAQLKNLGILDTQYQRQAQALSKTKDVAREALSSISDKYMRNKLENETNAVYQNLYNYRYDQNQHAWNMNQPANFNMSGNNTNSSGWDSLTPEQQKVAVEEAQLREARKAAKSRNGAILKAMRNL